MNLILLFDDDFVAGTSIVRLQGRRLRHVLEVHRASPGDELCVGLSGGLMGHGLVNFLDEQVLEMDVRLDREPPPPLPVTLILALPRPKVLRRVLSSVSAMGIKKIILLNSFRVEKSFWQSPLLEEENIRRQLILGLEQARDTVMPKVLIKPRFKPFVEDELPDLTKETLAVVAHPSASAPCPCSVSQPATVAIGPEGGFIPYEVEKLVSCGFQAVNLGERILGVETAVPFIISKLF